MCCAFALLPCVYPVCCEELELEYSWIPTYVMLVNCFLLHFLWQEAEAWSSCEPVFPHSSLCCDSCKVEVTYVNIYLITTCELCRALSSLWGRHDLHYNDTVDIFPVTLIVTSLLPVGICGLIRQLAQAIWSCDETRQEGGGWDLRGKAGGKRILGVSEHTEHLSMWANLILSPMRLSPCLWIHKRCRTQRPYSSSLAIGIPGTGGSAAPSSRSSGFLGSQTHRRRRSRRPCFILQTPWKQGWLGHPVSILRPM